jgi:capsular exopolysaccharide synthesis family protein
MSGPENPFGRPALPGPLSIPDRYLPADEPPRTTLRDIWGALRRNLWVFALCVGVALAAAMLYTSRQQRVYGSEATLQFANTRGSQSLLSQVPSFPGMGGGGSAAIETDLSILQSRRIAEAVTDSLGLRVRVVEPEIPRSRVFSRVRVARGAPAGSWELRRQPDGSYEVWREGGERAETRAAPGEPLRLGAAEVTLDRALRDDPSPAIQVAVVPFRTAVGDLRAGLDINQPNPKALVVSIRYSSGDPELAALVPNTLARSFIQYRAGTSRTESQSTVGFLREQVSNYERQLREAETSLRAFREGGQIVSLEDEASEQVSRLADLQARRDELEVERQSLRKLLDRAEAGAPGTGGNPLYRELAAFPVFLSNRAVQDILQSLTKLEDERATLSVRRTEANPDVAAIDRRIDELELQLYQTARSYLGSLENQIGSVDERLARFRSQMELVPGREIEFARLARQQKLLEEIYTLLHSRLKEAELQDAVQRSDVSILDDALVPQFPLAPRPLYNLALGGLLGLLLAGLLVVAREALDPRVRSRTQLALAISGRPVLGIIPGLGNRPVRRYLGRIPVPALAADRDFRAGRLEAQGPASEAFRALRTNLLLAGGDRAPQVVAVTSAMPGDGKSTSALQLATSFAQQEVRTLLVDADLRAGKLHAALGLAQETGLAEVLAGRIPLDAAIRSVPVRGTGDGTGFDLLAAGTYPANPAELLGSPRMRALVPELRSRYDMVIVDLPATEVVVDATLVARLADTTLFVMRYGVSHQDSVRQGIERLEQLGIRVQGVVLNDVPPGTTGAFGVYGAAAGGYERMALAAGA